MAIPSIQSVLVSGRTANRIWGGECPVVEESVQTKLWELQNFKIKLQAPCNSPCESSTSLSRNKMTPDV